MWCLGDVVGYGPKPNECVALLQERAAICLAGNHDLVVLGKISLATFGGEAGAAAAWTREVLDAPRTRVPGDARAERGHDRRGALPRQPARPGLGLRAHRRRGAVDARRHHGSARPRRSQPHRARARRRRHRGSRRPGGRGHDARPRGRAAASQPRLGRASLATAIRALPGSRLISRLGRATFRRTDYPVERTQAEMRELGLPEVLAARLEHGI